MLSSEWVEKTDSFINVQWSGTRDSPGELLAWFVVSNLGFVGFHSVMIERFPIF